MDDTRRKEEFLEALWHMKERGQSSLALLADLLREDFNTENLNSLVSENLVVVDTGRDTIAFTSAGESYGRRLIRAHRLAERLIHDALGGEAEQSACEFEHIVNPELIDGICTLLGHPRECPHGMRIPEGECCKRSATSAECPMESLTQLEIGMSARIAFVQCKNDAQLHKLEDLQIRPGVQVRLHQTYPSFVIECEGTNIALDRDIASQIRIWRQQDELTKDTPDVPRRRKRFRWGMKRSG